MIEEIKQLAAAITAGQKQLMLEYANRNVALAVNEAVNREYQHAHQYRSPVAEDGVKVCSGAARLFQVFGLNLDAATDFYLQAFDTDQIPKDGTVPDLEAYAFAGANFSLGLSRVPWLFTRGLYVCLSTTEGTKTENTGKEGRFYIQFLHDAPTPK